MKSIILAAGYATRLYPLTMNFPKPLLDVQGKTILDRLLANLNGVPGIDEHIVVSNHKFITHFEGWKKMCNKSGCYNGKVSVLDDGSTDNDNRLGAVKDIVFAIRERQIRDDILVVAGDNILDFPLTSFVEYQHRKGAAAIMRHEEQDTAKLQKTGVIEIGADDRVLSMQEKPLQPKSRWAVPPFYIYPADQLEELSRGIEAGCFTDAPGDFIAWYCASHPVYAWLMTGKRYDVGDLDSYRAVQKTRL